MSYLLDCACLCVDLSLLFIPVVHTVIIVHSLLYEMIPFQQNGTSPTSLASILRSPQWNAYATTEDRVYYVNIATQGLCFTTIPNNQYRECAQGIMQ